MIIIIGGTGFIGKHLCAQLHEIDAPAITFSRTPDTAFLNRYAPSIKAGEIGSLFSQENRSVIKEASALVYLASNSIPASTANSVVNEIDTNSAPAMALIDKITDLNPQLSLVYLSSGGTVYGAGHSLPITESHKLNPNTSYAFGKVLVEQYLRYLSATKGNHHAILRAANPVGEWHQSDQQGFIGAALRRMSIGEPISIFGDGSVTRDYFDANDLCRAIISVIPHVRHNGSDTWNVGSGVGTTLTELISQLADVTGISPEICHLPERNIDLNYNVLDCSKITHDIGWQCRHPIAETIARVWLSIK